MQNRTPSQPVVPAFTPVPRKYRHDGWTEQRQRAFIDALAETGSVKHAAKRINMSPEGAYALRRQPDAEEFRAAWAAALDHGVQRLEDIAMERALHGVEVPVYSYGKIIGSRIVHNDRLLMFLLRNRATHRFAAGISAKNVPLPPQAERPDGPNAIERLRTALDLVRQRTAETPDQIAYQEWLKAHDEGRAMILPRADEGVADPSPTADPPTDNTDQRGPRFG